MSALFLDFETEAIGDRPHAYPPKPVGYAYIFGKEKAYISWGHPGKNSDTFESAKNKLNVLLVWAEEVVCHNVQFDRDVCETHMELQHNNWVCTMTLAFLADPYGPLGLKPLAEKHLGIPPETKNALHDWIVANVPGATYKKAGAYISKAPVKLVEPYAMDDARMCKGLYHKWAELRLEEAARREMDLLAPILDMERHGVLVDVDKLEADTEQGFRELDKLDKWLIKSLGAGVDIDSDASVSIALEQAKKLSTPLPLTEKGAVSTAKKALIQCVADKQLLGRLLLRNALATCLRTFMTSWLEQAKANKGRVYFKFSPVRSEYGVGAKTGRLSSSPNMMNMPSTFEALNATFKEIGFKYPYSIPNLRQYILPDKDHVIVSADYSQIEMRVFAHFEDGALMKAYNENPDMDAHNMVAELAGVTRKVAKTLNFAALYGAGKGVIMSNLDCSEHEATTFKAQYNRAFPGVAGLNKSIRATLAQGDKVYTIGGRGYECEPPKHIKGRLQTFEYKMINYLSQGSAADIMKQAMINYHYAKTRRGRLMFVVHDEAVLSVPRSRAKLEVELLVKSMTDAFKGFIDVPLTAEAAVGNNYAEV